MNERDVLKHKLYFDKTYKHAENKEFENQLLQAKEELLKEQKLARDKVARLEEVSSSFVFDLIFFLSVLKLPIRL